MMDLTSRWVIPWMASPGGVVGPSDLQAQCAF